MSFSVNIHCCERLSAHSFKTSGAPLTITAIEDRGDVRTEASATFFTRDQVLTDRLIEAINAVVAARKAELEAEQHAREEKAQALDEGAQQLAEVYQ